LEEPRKAVHDYAEMAVEHYEKDNVDEAKETLVQLEEN